MKCPSLIEIVGILNASQQNCELSYKKSFLNLINSRLVCQNLNHYEYYSRLGIQKLSFREGDGTVSSEWNVIVLRDLNERPSMFLTNSGLD